MWNACLVGCKGTMWTNHRKPKCKNIQTKRKFSFMVSWSLSDCNQYNHYTFCCTHIHSSLSRKHKKYFMIVHCIPTTKYSVCKNKFQAIAHIRQRHLYLYSNKCQIMGKNVTYAASIVGICICFTKTYSIKLIQRLHVDLIVYSRIPIHHQQSLTTTYFCTYLLCK